MSFNPSKCHIISRKKKPIHHKYHLKNTELKAVDNATYLGVDISKDLSWHKQSSKVAAKGNRMLGFIKRNIRTPSQYTKEIAYKSLVRPTTEYASTVWSPHQEELIHKVEMVQRRAARFVLHSYEKKESVTAMLKKLQWETLEQRRLKARVVMGYRIVHGLVRIPDNQLIPTVVNTRGHKEKFLRIPAKTNYYKYSFFPSLVPLWNSLPPTAVSADDLDEFKEKLAEVHLRKPK